MFIRRPLVCLKKWRLNNPLSLNIKWLMWTLCDFIFIYTKTGTESDDKWCTKSSRRCEKTNSNDVPMQGLVHHFCTSECLTASALWLRTELLRVIAQCTQYFSLLFGFKAHSLTVPVHISFEVVLSARLLSWWSILLLHCSMITFSQQIHFVATVEEKRVKQSAIC